MENRIILVAETGSDIPRELAEELGIVLIPMHVSMGEQTLDDGAFPPEDICAYYDRTGKIPTTSGSTPFDFEAVYDEIFAADPDTKILHLAYSAVTTCSYHSCELAIEDKPYAANVRIVDTKHVSVGQCAVVAATAQWLNEHQEATLEEAAAASEAISRKTRMCFIPRNLDYLRAGGRCGNAAALVGNLLNLHPLIEVIDGRLLAKKKYRGAMEKVIPAVIRDFLRKENLSREHIWLVRAPYFEDALASVTEKTLTELGYTNFTWIPTGCVITCHGGPGAFGIVGTV